MCPGAVSLTCGFQWRFPEPLGSMGLPRPSLLGSVFHAGIRRRFSLHLLRKDQKATIVPTLLAEVQHTWPVGAGADSLGIIADGRSAHQPTFLLPMPPLSNSSNWENQPVQGKEQASTPTSVTPTNCVPGDVTSPLWTSFSSLMEGVSSGLSFESLSCQTSDSQELLLKTEKWAAHLRKIYVQVV